MKFTCTRENLTYALDIVSPLASKHANLPILMNVMITATEAGVEMSATNLEVAVKTHVRAKVDGSGSFTVPAKTLSDYVRLLTSEQVEISLKENELIITCGTSSTKIKGSSSDEYPVIPQIEEDHPYSLKTKDFRNGLIKAVTAVAKNEIRPELSGIYFSFLGERYSGLIMAATDSYRLSEVKVPLKQGDDKNISCIVPGRVAFEISRLLQLGKNREGEENVRLWISENQIAVRYDNFEMTSRLIEGTYPDYTQIIPQEFKTTATFDNGVMVNKIKAASLFAATGVNAVSFDLNTSQSTIGVSSTSTQTGEHSSEVDAVLDGEENSILLNFRYVLDGLSHMETNSVVFKVNGADAPCMFTSKNNDDFIYIVMPIRQ